MNTLASDLTLFLIFKKLRCNSHNIHLKCIIQWFLIHSQSCITINTIFFFFFGGCGIIVLWEGISPGLLQWKPKILTIRPPGNSFHCVNSRTFHQPGKKPHHFSSHSCSSPLPLATIYFSAFCCYGLVCSGYMWPLVSNFFNLTCFQGSLYWHIIACMSTPFLFMAK